MIISTECIMNPLKVDSHGNKYIEFEDGKCIFIDDYVAMCIDTIRKDNIDKMKNTTKELYEVNKLSKFGGAFLQHFSGGTNHVHITKVLYNAPATVVWWSDGTITRNICPGDALYNPDSGLAFCILKKIFDSQDIANLFNDWAVPYHGRPENVYVTLKDVRKKHK